jgi:hypothetical protein
MDALEALSHGVHEGRLVSLAREEQHRLHQRYSRRAADTAPTTMITIHNSNDVRAMVVTQ